MELPSGAIKSFASFTVYAPILTVTPTLSRKAFRKQRLRALVRDNFICQCEGCKEHHLHRLTVHHLIPRAAGGTDNLDNLVTVCWACHTRIHSAAGAGLVVFKVRTVDAGLVVAEVQP